MPSTQFKLSDHHARYTMAELAELRRTMHRYSRSVPPEPKRNQHLQIALSLRRLFKNKAWLDAHSVEGSPDQFEVRQDGGHSNAACTWNQHRDMGHACLRLSRACSIFWLSILASNNPRHQNQPIVALCDKSPKEKPAGHVAGGLAI
jgi:hypothetical protein